MKEQLLRPQLNSWLDAAAMKLNFQDKNILEIGIAGDDPPSGSYKFFGKGNKWTTLDKEAKWKPDIVADITQAPCEDDEFDLVIMTQALEHIWEYKEALSEIYRITSDYAIIDCPFQYAFHQDNLRPEEDWKKWDDYHRLTPAGMNRALEEVGFKEVKIVFSEINTLAICRKETHSS